MQVYCEQNLISLKDNYKKRLALTVVITAVVIALTVVLCFVVNDYNALTIQIINTAITTVAFWFLFASFNLVLVPANRYIKHVKKVISAPKKHLNGIVNINKNAITLHGGITATELVITANNTKSVIYWEQSLGQFDYDGKAVNVTVANNFVVSCEVDDEQK